MLNDMIQLRPYQLEQIDQVRRKFATGAKRVILCSPTGSGKTVTFTSIIARTVQKDLFHRVLIITDRIELFKQTWATLRKIDLEPVIYNATVKPTETINGRVVVAMIETLKSRWKRYGSLPIGQFDLIIIDEAHKGNFKRVFEIFPESRVIGATATPIATTKKDPLKNYYDDIVANVTIPDLIESGNLVPEQVYSMRLLDKSKLDYSSSKGDYTEASQYIAFSERKLFDGLINAYRDKAVGRKTIIFCPNIQMSEDVAKMLIGSGHDNVFCLTSRNSTSRDEILKKFHMSDSGVMVNCGILTTGYDHPEIEVCILYRATRSLPLYLQMIGRCSRPARGKSQMTVIDMGGNVDEFGLWSDHRDWKDIFWNPPKKGNPQPAPVKDCPECEAILSVRVVECPYCNFKFPRQQSKDLMTGELVEVKPLIGRKVSTLTAGELHILEKHGKIKATYAWRVARTMGDDYLKTYAKISGKKRGWLYYQSSKGKGFTDYTINHTFNA